MKTKQNNIFLIGPMGAGKTSVGRSLAKRLQKSFYDSDEEIEKRMGVNLHWIYDLEGEKGFRQREMKIIDDLTNRTDIVLATGGGCVETPEVREFLRHRGTIIFLQLLLDTQLNRLKYDKKRPLLQGDNRQEVLINLWEERESFYEQIADFTVLTDNRSVSDVVNDILAWLRKGYIQ